MTVEPRGADFRGDRGADFRGGATAAAGAEGLFGDGADRRGAGDDKVVFDRDGADLRG